jgi:hypothetical protein
VTDLTIRAYQRAYESCHNKPAPKITRGSRGGYVIHGEAGPSPSKTLGQMRVLTNAMVRWAREGVKA